MIFITGVITASGCAHHMVAPDPADDQSDAESEMDKRVWVVDTDQELIRKAGDCWYLKGARQRECADELSRMGRAKINIAYPYANQSYVENVFYAHFETDFNKTKPALSAEFKGTSELKLRISSGLKYYEALARQSHKNRSAQDQYTRRVRAADAFNSAADAQNARLFQGLHDASVDSRLDSLETNTAKPRFQSIGNGGINSYR